MKRLTLILITLALLSSCAETYYTTQGGMAYNEYRAKKYDSIDKKQKKKGKRNKGDKIKYKIDKRKLKDE